MPFNAVLVESNFRVTASKMKISVVFRERAGGGGEKIKCTFGQRKIIL